MPPKTFFHRIVTSNNEKQSHHRKGYPKPSIPRATHMKQKPTSVPTPTSQPPMTFHFPLSTVAQHRNAPLAASSSSSGLSPARNRPRCLYRYGLTRLYVALWTNSVCWCVCASGVILIYCRWLATCRGLSWELWLLHGEYFCVKCTVRVWLSWDHWWEVEKSCVVTVR